MPNSTTDEQVVARHALDRAGIAPDPEVHLGQPWLDFLARAMAGAGGQASASMTMGQPFPDVWLPRGLEINIRMLMAFGTIEMHYSLSIQRIIVRPRSRSKIGIPDRP